MAPLRFLQRWISLLVKWIRIDEVLLLVICLAAVFLLVMSFLLMSERTYAVRPWQTPAVVSRDIDGQVKRAEEKNDGMATDKVKESVNSIKTILLWNPYFDNDTYHFGLGRQPFEKNQCKVNTCSTTTDRQAALHADAVIFHSPEIDRRPTYRPPSQLYVFVQREPQYPKSRHVLNSYYDMFNLTMTYRHDSDIPIPYGQVVRIKNDRADNHHVYPDPRTKPRQVAWVVSHCHTLSRRELYVAELQRYIDVDVYGDCGKPTCNKTLNCFPDLEKKYKFYLAFENTFCQDYASEKLYRTLQYSMIPIVYGKINYTARTPEHSVIDILDFPNPKTLAQYLNYLGKNPDKYYRYFDWKKTYEVVESRRAIFGQAFCRLCEILHDKRYQFKDYRNISSWWLDNTCEIGFMFRLKRLHHW